MTDEDRRLIDALCRIQRGWSGPHGGDVYQDFHAANEIVQAHAAKVMGTFEPKAATIDKLRRALRDLTGGMKTLGLADKLPGPVERAEAVLSETE